MINKLTDHQKEVLRVALEFAEEHWCAFGSRCAENGVLVQEEDTTELKDTLNKLGES